MTFLPIVERELRVAARRKSTRRIRVWTTVAAIVVAGGFLLVGPLSSGTGAGGVLFQITTGYVFVMAAVAGVFVTSDCLSEEKRAGTLELLFLTDLHPHEIVLGKFIARMLNPFLAWLAVLPVLAFALLLGGVTAGEFWRVALALWNTLFLSLAVGVAVSAGSRDAQRAAGAVLGIMVLLAGLLPAVVILSGGLGWTAPLGWVNWLSPFLAYRTAMDVVYSGAPSWFWNSLCASHAFGWFWLLLATLTIRRTWQDAPVVTKAETVLRTAGRRARRRRVENNPVYWLMAASPGLEVLVWGLAATWAVAALAALQWLPESRWSWLYVAAKGVGLLLKIIFVTQVCRFFVEARRNGSLEMLLCTPVTNEEIIRAHWRHLRRVFLGPVLVFLLPVFLATLLAQDFSGGGSGLWSHLLANPWTGGGLMLIPTTVTDFLALGGVGLWLSLSMRKPSLAPGVTVLCVLLPPLFLIFLPDFFYAVLLFVWARERLGRDFRQRLSEQIERSP